MENKTSKYFKYAIGEIVLVVIGILIALSINTWNENNKSEKEASFQLSKLRDNLKADKVQLNADIANDSIYIDNLIFCVKVLSSEIEAPKEEFFESFQFMSTTISFNPTKGTFDGLISSGKIELINNQNLLDALFLYYNEDGYGAWDSALKDYSRNVIMPYLLDFDHISNVTDENEGSNFTQFDSSKFSIPKKTIDDYKNNLFIINALRQKIQLFEGQKSAYKGLLTVIDSLISNIENELKN
ncbi:MAG: hypothetical protein DA407_17115 [Bacteroidetes bacterium]|nr:MAG: hypothetical protein DA407_17115 [Bacteroidota bacterium]